MRKVFSLTAQNFIFAVVLAVGGWIGVAHAHGGGYPQITNAEAGPYLVTVWTQPQPLRIGEAHFTVAVSEPVAEGLTSSLPVLNATVELELAPAGTAAAALKLPATHADSINKLYYETDVELTEAGTWNILVTVAGEDGAGSTEFSVDVQPANRNEWILWGSVGLVAIAALWGARSFQNGGDLKRIIPVLLAALTVTSIGAAILTRFFTPEAEANVNTFLWPFIGPGEPDLVINVTASQWVWQFEYPASGVTTNQLALPAGKTVQLDMSSTDVIHTFGVPEFQLSQDILPNRITSVQVTPKQVGEYKVVCEAFCGLNYVDMLAQISVIEQEDFNVWLAQQKAK
jgi:heme/copper-type cytochrome/quinol oxidase subunit 2